MTLKRPLKGAETGADVRMVQRALNAWAKPSVAIPVTSTYDQRTQDRVMIFQAEQSVKPASGFFGQKTLDELWPYFDAYGRMRYRLFRVPEPASPDFGPVVKGGKSVLLHDLTHATAGIPGYPAFDDGWIIGLPCLAPEDMIITRQSSAMGGDAVFATGKTCNWWFGHISPAPATGKKFKRGQKFAVISADHKTPHLHVGLNTDRLLGHELEHHTDYTHGAPTVGRQLERAGL